MAKSELKRDLGFRDLILFYIVSGISLRWIATAAAIGPSSIVVWLLACFGFFLPLAGCVLELSSRYPQEGGLYVWTREAYGEFAGFMVAWTYWMCNLPYFPAVLYFAAGSLLFANRHTHGLANSNHYYLLFTVLTLVLITALNVIGLAKGKWLNNVGAIGMAAPVVALLILAVMSFSLFGSATHFSTGDMLPHAGIKNLVFWSTIFFAFGGCEAGSFMGEEIKDARRIIPRSLITAGFIIAISYIAGTIAMLIALPADSISGLGGFMTAIDFLCHKLGLPALVSPIAILVAVGSVGAAGAFLSATARLPFVAGIHHYLPAVFGRIHPRWKTPYVSLIAYGLAGIGFGLLSQAGTTVKGAYDLLVSMGIITYFIPYLFLFASMIRLQSRPAPEGTIRLIGGKRFAILLASVGLFSTAVTIVLSLLPSSDDPAPLISFAKIVVMTLVLLGAGAALYGYRQRAIRCAALTPD